MRIDRSDFEGSVALGARVDETSGGFLRVAGDVTPLGGGNAPRSAR